MRYTLICITFLSSLCQLCFAQTNIIWSDPIDVSPSSFGSTFPRIECNANNEVFISWGKNKFVYFTKGKDGVFNDPIQINNDTTNAYTAFWTGPELAVQNDLVYVSFMHQDWGKKTYLVRSSDGGLNFTSPMLIENYADSTSRFPSIAIDEFGQPIVTVMKMTKDGLDPNYVVRKSNDFGESYYTESLVGQWSNPESEACDCCPASIASNGLEVAIVYRDNDENIRNIWTTVSTDGGNSFTDGFAVDNNDWFINACPSSGPDLAIQGDTIYSVFYSDDQAYLSRSSISMGEILSLDILGEQPIIGTQNFPRISMDNNRGIIVWKGYNSGSKLNIAYSENMTDQSAFQYDTLYESTFYNADVVIKGDRIHIVWDDLISKTVKYISGQIVLTNQIDEQTDDDIVCYPNPADDFIYFKSTEDFDQYLIQSIDGTLALKGDFEQAINVSQLSTGMYLIKLIKSNGQTITKPFQKR